jgi:hypothetical protein
VIEWDHIGSTINVRDNNRRKTREKKGFVAASVFNKDGNLGT